MPGGKEEASYALQVDFGEAVGVRKSSAQITALYAPEQLVGRWWR